MKPVLEQKLRELIDESNNQIAPAMTTVLRLLLGAYLHGNQNDFAKHCCKFSPVGVMEAKVRTNNEAEDGWPDAGSEKYLN